MSCGMREYRRDWSQVIYFPLRSSLTCLAFRLDMFMPSGAIRFLKMIAGFVAGQGDQLIKDGRISNDMLHALAIEVCPFFPFVSAMREFVLARS